MIVWNYWCPKNAFKTWCGNENRKKFIFFLSFFLPQHKIAYVFLNPLSEEMRDVFVSVMPLSDFISLFSRINYESNLLTLSAADVQAGWTYSLKNVSLLGAMIFFSTQESGPGFYEAELRQWRVLKVKLNKLKHKHSEWLKRDNMKVLECPSRSPDLNPIGTLWAVCARKHLQCSWIKELYKDFWSGPEFLHRDVKEMILWFKKYDKKNMMFKQKNSKWLSRIT